MAHVIGIPLIKGNSEVILAADLKNFPQDNYFEGQAVGFTGMNSVQPNLVTLTTPNSKGFFGFIMDINQCSGRCSVVRAAESVCLPSDGSMVGTTGQQVLVDSATGLISATGDVAINGTVMNDGATALAAVNGKTGETVANPVIISLGANLDQTVAPPLAATAAKTTKAKSKEA